MASGITESYAQTLLGYLLGNTLSVPNTAGKAYLALSSTIPAANGTNFTELTVAGYARQPINISTTGWTVASNRVIKNATPIIYSDFTAAVDQVVAWGLFDTPSSGDLIMFGVLNTPRSVPAGGGVYFPAQELSIVNDNLSRTSPKGLLWANAQLNLLRGESPTPVSHVYLGLGSEQPTKHPDGSITFGELTGKGRYARVPIPVGTADWEIDGSDARMIKNKLEIRYVVDPSAPDIESQVSSTSGSPVEWNIRSYALFDALEATHPMYVENLGDDAVAYDKDIPRIKPGMLKIKE